MKMLRFARVWWVVGLALFAVVGPAAGGATVLIGPGDGLVVKSTPNPGVYGNIVWGIHARTASDAWAVGVKATSTSNDTLAMHWDGSTWTAVSTPNATPNCEDGDILWGGNSLSGVDAVSANDVWAVGSDCYSANAVIEHWDGSTWSLFAPSRSLTDGFGSTASLYDVEAISASNVWAVGYSGSSGTETLIEHYDGSGWSDSLSGGGMSGYLSSISATGPNDIWAVGSTGSGNLIEHFDGTNWNVVASPQPSGGSALDSVVAISAKDAWAVGSKSGAGARASTFTLHWNGSRWDEVPSPNHNNSPSAMNQLRSVAAVSRTNVWAVGMYEDEQTIHQHRTLMLHWDGLRWSIAGSPSPGRSSELNAVAAVPGQAVFAAGLFSLYDRNIYDGHYTLPQTLVMHG